MESKNHIQPVQNTPFEVGIRNSSFPTPLSLNALSQPACGSYFEGEVFSNNEQKHSFHLPSPVYHVGYQTLANNFTKSNFSLSGHFTNVPNKPQEFHAPEFTTQQSSNISHQLTPNMSAQGNVFTAYPTAVTTPTKNCTLPMANIVHLDGLEGMPCSASQNSEVFEGGNPNTVAEKQMSSDKSNNKSGKAKSFNWNLAQNLEFALLCFETASKQILGTPPYELLANGLGLSTGQLKRFLTHRRNRRLQSGLPVPPFLKSKKPDRTQQMLLDIAGTSLGFYAHPSKRHIDQAVNAGNLKAVQSHSESTKKRISQNKPARTRKRYRKVSLQDFSEDDDTALATTSSSDGEYGVSKPKAGRKRRHKRARRSPAMRPSLDPSQDDEEIEEVTQGPETPSKRLSPSVASEISDDEQDMIFESSTFSAENPAAASCLGSNSGFDKINPSQTSDNQVRNTMINEGADLTSNFDKSFPEGFHPSIQEHYGTEMGLQNPVHGAYYDITSLQPLGEMSPVGRNIAGSLSLDELQQLNFHHNPPHNFQHVIPKSNTPQVPVHGADEITKLQTQGPTGIDPRSLSLPTRYETQAKQDDDIFIPGLPGSITHEAPREFHKTFAEINAQNAHTYSEFNNSLSLDEYI